MRPVELLVLYGVLGVIVALSLHWRGRPGSWAALLAWPVLLPGLLAETPPVVQPLVPAPPGTDAARIDAALAGLRLALADWESLPREEDCAAALGAARRGMEALAARAAQLDAVVGQLSPAHAAEPADLAAARAHNQARLVELREEARARLERSLAAIAELTTRVQLARFTGDAGDAVAAQLARLAQAVDSAGEVSRLRDAS